MKVSDNICWPLPRSMPRPGWRGCPERRAAAYSAAPSTETESGLTGHSEPTWTVRGTPLRTCLRANTHTHKNMLKYEHYTFTPGVLTYQSGRSTGVIHSIQMSWLAVRHNWIRALVLSAPPVLLLLWDIKKRLLNFPIWSFYTEKFKRKCMLLCHTLTTDTIFTPAKHHWIPQ